METESTPQDTVRRRGGHRAKLNDQRVDAFLRRHAELGSSISEIRDALALAEPEGLALEVGRATVARRLTALGIKTKGISIMQAAKLSDDAIRLSTRQLGPGEVRESARRGQARVPSWLSPYKTEIGRMILEGMVYREIWDALAAANPMEPRFAQELSAHAKSTRIADFKYREAQKAERRRGRRARLLQVFQDPAQQNTGIESRSTQEKALLSPQSLKQSIGTGRAGEPVSEGSAKKGSGSAVLDVVRERESHRRVAEGDELAAYKKLGNIQVNT